MNAIITFVDKIRWQCHLRPHEPALALPAPSNEIVTYGQLDHYLNNACRNLTVMGVVPGTVYGLMVKDPLLHLVLSLALEQMGAATMALHDLNIPKIWTFSFILHDRDIGETARATVRVDQSWLQGDGRPLAFVESRGRSPDDMCRLSPTSGSSGTPKAVVFTHRAWELRMAHYDYVYGAFAFLQRTMSCIVGTEYRYCVYALSRGGMYCFPDPSIESTARKIASYKIQFLAASATTLAGILAVSPSDRKGFSSLELIGTTGSHLPRKVFEKVRELMCHRVLNSYGSTETGVIAAAWADALDLDGGEAGFIIPGTQVDVVDPQTRQPMTGGRGALRIRSIAMASGYLGGDPANAFEGGAFYSHDLGSISPDGRVTLQGRSTNVLNLGGDKATIEGVELHYSKGPGVSELAATPVRDGLGITRLVAVIVPNEQWSESVYWTHLRASIPSTFWPLRLVVVQDLPRGSNGKVDRSKLAALVSA